MLFVALLIPAGARAEVPESPQRRSVVAPAETVSPPQRPLESYGRCPRGRDRPWSSRSLRRRRVLALMLPSLSLHLAMTSRNSTVALSFRWSTGAQVQSGLLDVRTLELELQAAQRSRCIAGERAIRLSADVSPSSGSTTQIDDQELARAVAAMRAHAVAEILRSP